MTDSYKAGNFRQTIAAIACAIVFSSTVLLGTVAPANAVSVPAAAHTRIAA